MYPTKSSHFPPILSSSQVASKWGICTVRQIEKMYLIITVSYLFRNSNRFTFSSNNSSICGVRLTHMKPVPKSSINVYINLVVVDSNEVGQHLQQNLHPSLPKQQPSCEFKRWLKYVPVEKHRNNKNSFELHTCELQHPCLAMFRLGKECFPLWHCLSKASNLPRPAGWEWWKKNDDDNMWCLLLCVGGRANPGAAC